MINSKFRAKLRSQGSTEPIVAFIGKEGLTSAVIDSVNKVLIARELIKVKVLANCESEIRQVCDELCGKLRADSVSIVGRTFIIYRVNPKLHK